MRLLQRNKTLALLYANKGVGEIENDYGETQIFYGDVKALKVHASPLENVVEAEQFGVDVSTAYKVRLEFALRNEFDKHTRIWIKNTPNIMRDNNDYKVAMAPMISVNECYIVIDKKIGK